RLAARRAERRGGGRTAHLGRRRPRPPPARGRRRPGPSRELHRLRVHGVGRRPDRRRSEEHTSELQSRFDLVCRLLLEKKNESLRPPRTRDRPPHLRALPTVELLHLHARRVPAPCARLLPSRAALPHPYPPQSLPLRFR